MNPAGMAMLKSLVVNTMPSWPLGPAAPLLSMRACNSEAGPASAACCSGSANAVWAAGLRSETQIKCLHLHARG